MLVQRIELLPHSSSFYGLTLCFGYSLGGVSHVFPMAIWVSSRISNFLTPVKKMNEGSNGLIIELTN